MNDLMKFRAWDKWQKRMIQPHDGDFIKWHAMSNWKECLEVMLYSDVPDINEKNICVGDIVNWYLEDDKKHCRQGVVSFGEHNTDGLDVYSAYANGFYLDVNKDLDVTYSVVKGMLLEVIGNIYEDAHLLEVKE